MKLEKLLDECYEYKRKQVSIASASFKTKTRYEFVPNGTISKISFDQCIMNQSEKCDYLFIYEKSKEEHLIFLELKDSDLIKAISQIDNTLNIVKDSNNLKEKTVHARIVLTKIATPDLQDSRLVRFRKKMENANGSFDYKSQKMVENIIK